MDIHQVSDIFTPTTPARLTFVEREEINKRIVRGLSTPGNQLVVYGHSGCGKTTLLENKLHQVYENHIRTNCMKGMTYEGIILDAFDQLAPYYITNIETLDRENISTSLSSEYISIKAQISTEIETSTTRNKSRVLPPQLTAQNLARFMGESGSCWVLEDFHKLKKKDKEKLAQLMKVFMDMSDTYKDIKIIYIGAVKTAREVVQFDREMRRRVSEIHVPLMTEDEIIKIIHKGFSLLNIGIDDKQIIWDIYNQCSGLPAICHKLCLLICEDMDIKQTSTEVGNSNDPDDYIEIDDSSEYIKESKYTAMHMEESGSSDPYDYSERDEEDLKPPIIKSKKQFQNKNRKKMDNCLKEDAFQFNAINTTSGLYVENENLQYAFLEYLEDESDTIKCAFEQAFKEKHSEDIIEALSECDEKGASTNEILSTLIDINASCTKKVLNKTLKKLVKNKHGAVIRHYKDSDKYCFSEPFYRTFALSYFEKKIKDSGEITLTERMRLLNKAFGAVQEKFTI
ncbi:ATP-binding protein [Cocleimonas sp. KMM 6892]|uniref:ATP-binding protein n=1 Tax=unclassified Cocleimonas TaxID=2639732 RepID=UPI002DB74FE3|nr:MULTISPECIES: ATP-binding protein [unclassified Cocleimonas]MEB8433240.1 ATP-binding protein [Cocleimonas sp. KMM 6892]MEC4715779.1 ATP-binding protein [Cocleimonas sp. KMM 6895]MEC4745240.1 ATP-binding protein [Cocleimonas sp. KMM 6896]